MNKKIIIEGKKVHNVGYRPFLLEKAQELCIPNFYTKNMKENSTEEVVILLDGESGQITEFLTFIRENQPENAQVTEIREDPNPPRRVMLMDSYVHLLNTGQLSKIVQTGLKMLDKEDETIEAHPQRNR